MISFQDTRALLVDLFRVDAEMYPEWEGTALFGPHFVDGASSFLRFQEDAGEVAFLMFDFLQRKTVPNFS